MHPYHSGKYHGHSTAITPPVKATSDMTPEQQATFGATMAAAGSKATYTGAGASIMGWVLSSEFGVFIGLMLGVGGFAINWYYKAKEDRRQQAEHDRRMGLYE